MTVATRMKLWESVENMTAIEKIESFYETQEKWETYAESVEQCFFSK